MDVFGQLIKLLAEREGFEPSVALHYTRLAGEHHRPLGHLSAITIFNFKMAEEVGFEPTELAFNGFQDRRLKPLGHSSVTLNNITEKLSDCNEK